MKQVVYRNIMGTNPRKKEISIEEISGKVRSKVSKKWICKYFMKESYTADDSEDLQKWIMDRKREKPLKDCHILRHMDTRTGENKVVCKSMGEFFVIRGNTVHVIVFVNEFKVGYAKQKQEG